MAAVSNGVLIASLRGLVPGEFNAATLYLIWWRVKISLTALTQNIRAFYDAKCMKLATRFVARVIGSSTTSKIGFSRNGPHAWRNLLLLDN